MKSIVMRFLEVNGFKKEQDTDGIYPVGEFVSFTKGEYLPQIDVSDDEIVFISDEGDWLHIELDYFKLLGVLLHYRLIGIGFKGVN